MEYIVRFRNSVTGNEGTKKVVASNPKEATKNIKGVVRLYQVTDDCRQKVFVPEEKWRNV